jgi:NitT/TauT family transport system ATP-binding protein
MGYRQPAGQGDIRVRNLHKRFGSLEVFSDLTLTFKRDRITVVLGPSGCGKTTLLNLLAGMDRDYTGSIGGLEQSTVSYLFQEPRLLPWKTVAENIEFVLPEGVGKQEKKEQVTGHLGLVGLAGFADYYPGELSGGMKQRTAVARAFAYPSDTILMDEPFQALDLGLKLSLVEAFLSLWRKERRTVIFVTHDIQEALLLGDSLVLLSDRPARVVETFPVVKPQENRSLKQKELLSIEQELYTRLGITGGGGE